MLMLVISSFNHVFPGNAISMAAPLGTFETGADADKEANKELDAKSRDISAFLMWASEPHLNARKSLGSESADLSDHPVGSDVCRQTHHMGWRQALSAG